MKLKKRRLLIVIVSLLLLLTVMLVQPPQMVTNQAPQSNTTTEQNSDKERAAEALEDLTIKGRSPKTGYSRDQFGSGWQTADGCDTRNIILNRDLQNTKVNDSCQVESGSLNDPYTGQTIDFIRGAETSADIQIDHVVALADAWQKGAQLLSKEERVAFANDPLELLAADGDANQKKGGSDAASWLPSNKAFRCEYIARQIAIKLKYNLWITQAEYDAMARVLGSCPDQRLP